VDDERQQADMLLNDISRMKNFVQTTYRCVCVLAYVYVCLLF
jgi:hypothetical protein